MGARISKVYTRTGDAGETGLADGSRVAKDGPRVAAMGAVDELNATIGVVLAHCDDARLSDLLTAIQHDLFEIGGELAIPGRKVIEAADVERLEASIDACNAALPPLQEFVLPGGPPGCAFCHQARTVARRAETTLVALARVETVNKTSTVFVNRLSDFLFVVCRLLAAGEEKLWDRQRRP